MGIPLSLGDVSHRSAAVTAICVAVPVLGSWQHALEEGPLSIGEVMTAGNIYDWHEDSRGSRSD